MPSNTRMNETTVHVLTSLHEHSRSFASEHGVEIDSIREGGSVEAVEFLSLVIAEDAARADRC